MNQRLDHRHTAHLLDRVHHAVAALAHSLPSSGAGVGTVGGALAQVNTGLRELRRLLDARTVAAGLSSPFVRRDMKAGPELAAAARIARRAALEAEEAMLEERRRRTWRGAHSPHSAGPSATETATGEDDCSGSPHNGPEQWPSAAAPPAGDAIAAEPSPTESEPENVT